MVDVIEENPRVVSDLNRCAVPATCLAAGTFRVGFFDNFDNKAPTGAVAAGEVSRKASPARGSQGRRETRRSHQGPGTPPRRRPEGGEDPPETPAHRRVSRDGGPAGEVAAVTTRSAFTTTGQAAARTILP